MVVALVGASGRLGSVVNGILKRQHLVFEVDKEGGEYKSLQEIPFEYDIIVDCSCADQSVESTFDALENGIPVVIACTGHTEAQIKKIKECSKIVPVFLSYNMAIGAEVFKEAADLISQRFDSDVHIHEEHHAAKKDAPSGTALSLREVISKNNPKVEISSARGGDVIGNHEVSFFGKNEIIRLSHLAENRNAFAEGICKAAEYLRCCKPGFYDMSDLVEHFPIRSL